MIKVLRIVDIKPYKVTCAFNNGMVKTLDVIPLIINQMHLNGVDQLMDESIFKKAKVGKMGELVWEKIITITNEGKDVVWDYDISPEFVFQNSLD